MYKIQNNFIDTLKRINFIFKNKEIFTECINNNESFSILGEIFGPFEKGKKYKLKLFIALPFIENNILRVASNEKFDNVDVQRYAIAERDDQRLTQQKHYFLNKIKEFKKFMEKDVNDNLKLPDSLHNYNSYFSNIIDIRLLKLLRLSKAELTLDDERKLTNSEKLLYQHIYNLINKWRNFFLGKRE